MAPSIKSIARRVGKVGKKVAGGIHKAGRIAYAAGDMAADVMNPVNRAKMYVNAARGKGLVYPGSNYIGPGNPIDNGKTTSKADANAKQHDIDYGKYLDRGFSKKRVYAGYSDADERLLNKTKINSGASLAVNLGMGAKKLGHKLGLTGPKLKDTEQSEQEQKQNNVKKASQRKPNPIRRTPQPNPMFKKTPRMEQKAPQPSFQADQP